MIKISKKRLILKTITWRIIAAVITFLTVYILSGLFSAGTLAILASCSDMIFKTLSYYIHEGVWDMSHYGKELDRKEGITILLTGLPCSGKTTIAKKVKEILEKRLLPVEHLDGDILRRRVCSDLGFSKADRDENIRRVALLSSYLSESNIVLCTFVSPYKKARKTIKEKNIKFLEVFVDCPIEECIRRDVKGMYKKALAGEIKNFTGIDDPYEIPEKPDIICVTVEETIEQSAAKIINHLKNIKVLS